MTTQKRRVVYFSDEEWADARERAQTLHMTISAYIRSSVIGGNMVPKSFEKELRRFAEFRPAPKPGR